MEYFRQLAALLRAEQEEDRQQYEQLAAGSTVADRRAAGLTWYPVVIRDAEMSRGDYLTIEVERTSHHDLPHQLRFGASAVLFSNHQPAEYRAEGTISYQGDNRLRLTLRTDELPDWSRDGKLGIDLLFDDNSYDEMQYALRLATKLAEKKEEGRLISILTGNAVPGFSPRSLPVDLPSLNTSQQQAVDHILAADELAIVHGPPGTGKTTTLVQAVKALIRQGAKQVLVTAPSNTAVDLLSERLAGQGLNVVRVGNPARVSEQLMSLTLDHKAALHPAMKEAGKLKKRANEFRNLAHKYKRQFGKAEREQRKALFDEARAIMKQVEQAEQYVLDDLLNRAQVITATLVGASHFTVRQRRYDAVVIDEAGQALEPACWIPLLKGKKLVLAGDHCQLPPTVKSVEAAKGGLSVTLLEKAIRQHPQAVVLLNEQYRMHRQIMQYSSTVFYENALQAHASVAGHLLFPGDSPLLFVDTAGCGFEEKHEGVATSNPEEAAFLGRHLAKLVATLRDHYSPENFLSIGIISPYRQQIQVIKEIVTHHPVLLPYLASITVNTIDSFQGQERDIIYISMTRSNTSNRIGFLSDTRRMNVAMTRARKKLVVIGDSGTLAQLPFYAGFIEYAGQAAAYQSAWELVEE